MAQAGAARIPRPALGSLPWLLALGLAASGAWAAPAPCGLLRLRLEYPGSDLAGTLGTPITAEPRLLLKGRPFPSAGGFYRYVASRALPAGLTLDSRTGVISGTPLVLAPRATYTITLSVALLSSRVPIASAPVAVAVGTAPAAPGTATR